jgi:hypothetical protein
VIRGLPFKLKLVKVRKKKARHVSALPGLCRTLGRGVVSFVQEVLLEGVGCIMQLVKSQRGRRVESTVRVRLLARQIWTRL